MRLTRTTGPHRSSEWMNEHSGTFTLPVSTENLVRTICEDDVGRAPCHVFSELDEANKGEPL